MKPRVIRVSKQTPSLLFKKSVYLLCLAVLGPCCYEGFSVVVVSRVSSLAVCSGFSLRWRLVAGHRL